MEDIHDTQKNILDVNLTDQYHTAEELFELSQSGPVYYTLLIIASVIVGAGLLLQNDAVVIGGTLVAPLLVPLLFISLALAAGRPRLLPRVFSLLMRSTAVVIVAGLLLGFFFGSIPITLFSGNIERAAILYLLVAFAAGAAGAFAWARKDVAEVLPGIALAVTILPPLSAVGISLEQLDVQALRYFLIIFVFNVVGILAGALVVFSLLKFYRTGDVLEMHERKQKEEEEQKEEVVK